jgi:hypothetical protein
MSIWFRLQPENDEPRCLLDPERQRSEPWEGTVAELAGAKLVVLRGEPSGDDDFDADEGAVLVRPSSIVYTRAPDRRRIEELRRELGETGTLTYPAASRLVATRASWVAVRTRTRRRTTQWLT